MLKLRSIAGSIPLKQETGMYKIFIDGQAGTTGLQIHERLQDRADIEILAISDAQRKDTEVKSQIIEAADVVILCLPDDAARETVQLAPSNKARFIDASTAHRIHPEWVYGLPCTNNATTVGRRSRWQALWHGWLDVEQAATPITTGVC